jgi:hypothetical protein
VYLHRFTLADGRPVVLALSDDANVAAIKIGTDPNLLVAHRGRITSHQTAEAIAACCRAVE